MTLLPNSPDPEDSGLRKTHTQAPIMAPGVNVFADEAKDQPTKIAPDMVPPEASLPAKATLQGDSENGDPEREMRDRPFFWEIVRLCDLYSVVNLVLLPSLALGTNGFSSPLYTSSGSSASDAQQSLSGQVMRALCAAGCTITPKCATSGITVFHIILPTASGYVNRTDFFPRRFHHNHFPIAYERAVPLKPLEKYNALALTPETSLPTMIERAAYIIQLRDWPNSFSISRLQELLPRATQSLKERLDNAPWLSPELIARKRVALVRGRPNLMAGLPIYAAATCMGIHLVIIDDPGHWLEPTTPGTLQIREAFLATDMTENDGVVDRIIASLEAYPLPIHGIFTVSDNFFVTVAKVAQALGLPTSPVSAYETSVDKYRSRLLQDVPGATARVANVAELEALMEEMSMQPQIFQPTFPMIVKPTKGWSSECVSKVARKQDLAAAVERATGRHGSAAVIEPYFEGPEIDVNFVLLNGEILFCEIADEPPCSADARSARIDDDFSPVALTLPSALPREEQEIAKTTLHKILVDLGFRTGVFHVEARMVNSSHDYFQTAPGVIDLARRRTPPPGRPTCRLIEINARPPGYRVSVPSYHVYGVDYFAAHMLAAVGDHARLRMIARPYETSPENRTPDAAYWARLVYIPAPAAPAAGIVRWPTELTPTAELKGRLPELAKRIVLGVDYFRPGTKIEPFTDGARTYIGHVLVYSDKSRQESIELGNRVLEEYWVEVEEEWEDVAS